MMCSISGRPAPASDRVGIKRTAGYVRETVEACAEGGAVERASAWWLSSASIGADSAVGEQRQHNRAATASFSWTMMTSQRSQ